MEYLLRYSLNELNSIKTGRNSLVSAIYENVNKPFPVPSPLALDKMRAQKQNDFHLNGIDIELNDYDLLNAEIRAQKPPGAWSLLPSTTVATSLQDLMKMREEKRIHKMQKVISAGGRFCVLCRNNGEPAHVYNQHILKDGSGRVTCPVLRKYKCPLCGKSGDDAHTIRYCPLYNGDPTSAALLKSSRQSDGRRRRYPSGDV